MGKVNCLILIFTLFLITSCSDNYKMENVTEEFPNSEIVYTPNRSNDFIVRKPDGSVWYVRCDNPFSGKVTSRSQILPMKR
jgi:hypothetical protein